jgi:regulator of protease activity HflC (stomatin/prohibitin superfamily)
MSRIRTIFLGLLSLLVILWGLFMVWKWGITRVFVGPDEVLVVINRFGEPLPEGMVVVPRDHYDQYKGIREEVQGPGRYFINPVFYETEVKKVTIIHPGQPDRWTWSPDGKLIDLNTAPQIGLVARRQGKPGNTEVVDAGFKGIQKEVLTPGVYKINPYLDEVKPLPAMVIPPGSVGVVTRLFGESTEVVSATLTEIVQSTTAPTTQQAAVAAHVQAPSRLVVGENQRGVLRDVLQPGIYYVNPRMYKIDILPVGYDALTLENRPGAPASHTIRFLSKDGYQVDLDFTVVWGVAPADAPTIIANIGGWDRVEENVIKQAMISACQNEGARYTAKELIQGSTRSAFQEALETSLDSQVSPRNIHVLLALIRNIGIKDNTGQDATRGLLATIQQANIEVERQITNVQKTATEKKRAELEQAMKLVDVARETVVAETKVKVANILAEGQKKAAEIDAQREVEVAAVQQEIALLDAQTVQILGKAQADVARAKNEAEAKGAKLLIDAFGSPQAYNNYIFARNFDPSDLRLIFAGPGTFWTDLKSFQEIGGANQILQQTQPSAAPVVQPPPAPPAQAPAAQLPMRGGRGDRGAAAGRGQ